MYLGGVWYECFAPVDATLDPIKSLDVSVLQKEILEKILGITDPRARHTAPVHRRCTTGLRPRGDGRPGRLRGRISMQPVKVESVLDIADAGGIMPPKSTWFEPKLLSGLAVHRLE